MNASLALLITAAGLVAVASVVTPVRGDIGRAHLRDDLLIIETGDYVVRFRQDAAWTIHSADYQGHPLLTPTGAYQTVLKIRRPDGQPAEWIGTGHGGEADVDIALLADGEAHPVSSQLNARGTTFTVRKTSRLGPYAHEARMTVGPDGIAEDLRFEMVGEPLDIELMYAFMHCFNNQTQHWLVGSDDGSEQRGTFTDDNSFTLRQDIRWAAVYAPSMQVGMAYAYPQSYAGHGTLRNMFWNRPRDNKLYLTVQPSQEPGARFSYRVQLRAFPATGDDGWDATARQTLKPMLAAPHRRGE